MPYGYVTPDNGFTVECWFRSGVTLPTYAEVLFGQQSLIQAVPWSASPQVNGRHFMVYKRGTAPFGAIVVDIFNKAGTELLDVTDPTPGEYVNDDAWHFCAVRVGADKRTVTMWVDGEKKIAGTVMATAIDWTPGALVFGGTYAPHLGNFGTYLLTGGLNYCAVWDTALTDARVAEHYTAGSGGTVFYGDDEVTRLRRIYDLAGVPASAQRFDDPVTTLQGLEVAGQNALEKAKATVADAGGLVFADGQSTMVYHNRRHRYNRPVTMVLSESRGSAPDVGMAFSTDDTKVINDVRANRSFGGSARIRNRASEAEYGRRVYEVTWHITDDDEMRNGATWLAERYGEDRVRIEGVTLSAESSDDIQYLVETVSIGDKVAFDDLPDNAPSTYLEYIIEGMSVNASFKDQTWELGLELSPAELWNVLQVGVSTLGDGSRIAF